MRETISYRINQEDLFLYMWELFDNDVRVAFGWERSYDDAECAVRKESLHRRPGEIDRSPPV